MTQPENTPNYLELIRERGSGALDKKMGIEILAASPERLVGRMPVEGNTQPIGLLHGGANVVLAESLGSIGTQLNAGPNRRIVGVDINATHHKSAMSGYVTGVATAVSIGKTLCVYEVVITKQAEREGAEVLICTGDRDSFQLVTDKTTVLYPNRRCQDM